MTADEVDEMLSLMKNQERLSKEHASREEAGLRQGWKMVDLREKQIKLLEELVKEIRRLRVTGIQP